VSTATASSALLVVDDDPMNRDALSRRLTRTGYRVLTAPSGADALAVLATERIDAVLLDVMMPGMSGLETLKRIRQVRSISDLPVIMVTAKDGSDDVVEALDLGANDYVTKPIDYAVALARIRAQVMSRRSDPLTGLPNRLLFLERLRHLMAHADEGKCRRFALLFLDLDRFKVINDSLGHAAGDELLVKLAKRLKESLRATDLTARYDGEHTLARMGGDEFTILLDNVADAERALAIGERLREAVSRPFMLGSREVVTSASIGIVLSARRYQSAEDMVRDADTAMYRAKSLRKSRCQVFDASMREAATKRLQLESDLRGALDRREFEVYYQPIVSLKAGRLNGFEALLRWRHPTRGLIFPGDFIGIAEDTGLIVPIGRWVLEDACRQMRRWSDSHPTARDLLLNVNVSARQCMDPDLVRDVARVLDETGLPAARVKLELTEGIVLDDTDAVIDVLNRLRALGVQLGLDDFGMGYSALSYLQRFPIQTIKIDRAFVHGIAEQGNAEIIRAIVSMAEGLQMDVTAEGVETAEQMVRLQELACEFAQGYYFREPLTKAAAENVLGHVGWLTAEAKG
jgi:diguanylate cyclase (GGDEF)-like protein